MIAIESWRTYLQRGPFIIKIEHKILCNLEDQVLNSELQRKAMTKLIGLQYKFKYKKGIDNIPVDALSRVGHLWAVQAVSKAQLVWLHEVISSYERDVKAQELLTQVAINGHNEQRYALVEGLIKYHGKIWIGANAKLQTKLINALHTSPVGDIQAYKLHINVSRSYFIGLI